MFGLPMYVTSPPRWAVALVGVVLSYLVAELSWRLVEERFLRREARARPLSTVPDIRSAHG